MIVPPLQNCNKLYNNYDFINWKNIEWDEYYIRVTNITTGKKVTISYKEQWFEFYKYIFDESSK